MEHATAIQGTKIGKLCGVGKLSISEAVDKTGKVIESMICKDKVDRRSVVKPNFDKCVDFMFLGNIFFVQLEEVI